MTTCGNQRGLYSEEPLEQFVFGRLLQSQLDVKAQMQHYHPLGPAPKNEIVREVLLQEPGGEESHLSNGVEREKKVLNRMVHRKCNKSPTPS